MTRQERKLDHLRYAESLALTDADFSEVELLHNCLPETDLAELDLSTKLAGLPLSAPFLINAITGGVAEAIEINRNLAAVAKAAGFAMAVGSQMAALENPAQCKSFRIVREVYPQGIIFANIGAYADAELAKRAVEMIEADALQIHLNVPQELLMAEGDTSFRGYRKRIAEIIKAVKVPVIIKEVGFGVAKEQAALFQELGAAAIDIGGRGGTNFLEIESKRGRYTLNHELLKWGISTPLSILEARTGAPALDIVATGGINNGLAAAKAISLGASAVGMAGLPLKVLLAAGPEKLLTCLQQILHELKMVMMMTGCFAVKELQRVPVVITGKTREWMLARDLKRE
ncbi:MAG: type 2 isopentenyl-diphosphate Delta-isomerase [Firmicutes bacterium]|nr:type 2 isopentenyl-diphosphate Delta-isomerase [Bacillota bacterium]